MKHVFIIDPKPFRGQQWKMDGLLDSLGQFFRTQEKPNFTTVVSKYPREAIGIIQNQIDEREEEWEVIRVYAVGGDEMLFDCLNGIGGLPDIELALMPYGASNDFIRAFGEGKADAFKDIQAIVEGPVIPTDMIAVGNSYAINGCSIGLAPAVNALIKDIIANQDKGIGRHTLRLQFMLGRLITVFNNEIISHPYKVVIDDEDYSDNYSQINIVNGPFFGNRKTAVAGVSPNDGLLDVALFKSVQPLALFGSMEKYARGKIPSNCVRVQAKKIIIRSEKPVWIQTDTELLRDTHLAFEIVPEAVQVVAVNNLTYQKF